MDEERKRPPYHVIELRNDGWALEHEEACFQAGSLLDCPVHEWASEGLQSLGMVGRYRVEQGVLPYEYWLAEAIAMEESRAIDVAEKATARIAELEAQRDRAWEALRTYHKKRALAFPTFICAGCGHFDHTPGCPVAEALAQAAIEEATK